jgi:hypothetical protein
MTAGPALDTAILESRRRLAFRAALIALVVAGVGFPLGMSIGGSERSDTIGGALLLAAIAGTIAAPWIVRAWQGFMRRRMIAAAVAGDPISGTSTARAGRPRVNRLYPPTRSVSRRFATVGSSNPSCRRV